MVKPILYIGMRPIQINTDLLLFDGKTDTLADYIALWKSVSLLANCGKKWFCKT